MVAEDARVLHRELDALAGLRAAVHEVAREDDAVALARREAIEQLERFAFAPVQIADDDGSVHFCP